MTSVGSKKLQLTWQEFETHKNDKESLWFCVNDKVYDVATWLNRHPGGDHVLINIAGKDATDVVTNFHPPHVLKMMTAYHVGDIHYTKEELATKNKNQNAEFVKDMRDLHQFFLENGWYKPNTSYFIVKTLFTLSILIFALWCTFHGKEIHNVYLQLLGGLMIGLFWQQSNFLGHDAGHSSVVVDKFADLVYGTFVGPISSGLSIQWWKHTHYTHHVMTNVYTHDPDIQHLPVLAVTNKYFKGCDSKYWGFFIPFTELTRQLVSYQHLVYFPVMTVSRVNMHIQSILHVLFSKFCPNRMWDAAGTVIFWCWWIYTVAQLPTWGSLALFYYLSHFSVALIHVQICLSHFYMETFEDFQDQMTIRGDDFYSFQLKTTLDVKCTWYEDWIHGGLQYQTCHHLYPRLPRNRLRQGTEMIIAICAKHGKKYHSYYFFEANMLTIEHMYDVAMQARAGKMVPFEDTMIFQGANMIG